MNTKVKNIVICVLMAIILFTLSALCLFGEKKEFLDTERRPAAEFPELSYESIMKDGVEYSDSFMSKFEKYALDIFPFRDAFRTLKAFCANYVFLHKDNNNIFISDGYAAEMQYPLNDSSIEHATSRFEFIYNRYLKDLGITPYISIIPDKAYFLAEKNGNLSMDYEKFVQKFSDKMDYAEYIDIFGELSIEDYYKTDTHWRQEKLVDIAEILVNAMGGSYDSTFDINKLDNPFYGVYYGQAALPLPAETIYYLTNENILNVKVYDHQNNREISLYDMEKAYGKDPYDMFMSGELSLVTIENPNAKTDKELIIFRDSFGRSIIPLMAEDYAKITVIDIRYLPSPMLGAYVNFENAEVLFLYSTLVLNASATLN
ncbi:MAG: DHHW family protein [Clostridia bacterium]|nr:DHHW family protein [Clostridia bacterium]